MAIVGYLVAIVGIAMFLMIAPKLPELLCGPDPAETMARHSIPDASQGSSPVKGVGPAETSVSAIADSGASGVEGVSDQPVRTEPAQLSRRDGSFIPLDFSLPGGSQIGNSVEAATEGSIKVRKLVRSGNAEVGAINVTIDQNSRLLLDAGDVRTLVASRPDASKRLADLPESGLVTTRALRDRGIDFRYDPNTDVISLELR